MDLRPVTWDDRGLLYEWRRQDEESAVWWEGNPVTVEAHNTWLRTRLDSPAVRMWIAEESLPVLDAGGNPKGRKHTVQVGQARVDSSGELSYSIVPDYQGAGRGTKLVRQAVRNAPYAKLKAAVDRDNVKGRACLVSAGFEERPDVAFYMRIDQ